MAADFRSERGLQTRIARETGLSQAWICKLAQGRVPNVNDARKLEPYGYPLNDWEVAPQHPTPTGGQ